MAFPFVCFSVVFLFLCFCSMHCICSAFVAFCFSTCFLAVLLDFTFSYNMLQLHEEHHQLHKQQEQQIRKEEQMQQKQHEQQEQQEKEEHYNGKEGTQPKLSLCSLGGRCCALQRLSPCPPPAVFFVVACSRFCSFWFLCVGVKTMM